MEESMDGSRLINNQLKWQRIIDPSATKEGLDRHVQRFKKLAGFALIMTKIAIFIHL
jgi:hypothetical protein